VLPNQNGAPVRVVVPWKYGFKSAKSIVRIRFLEQAAQDQLGDLRAAGVRLLLERQPERRPPALEPGHRAPHRRGRPVARKRPTLMFNGYEQQVGSLYTGMDLKKFY
jgi:sulfoxide reductase catalytic subunit YedY